MKMTNEQFDNLRYYVEILGYLLACALSISDVVGFKYGAELGGIIAAINYCLGNIVEAARKRYEAEKEIKGDDVNAF